MNGWIIIDEKNCDLMNDWIIIDKNVNYDETKIENLELLNEDNECYDYCEVMQIIRDSDKLIEDVTQFMNNNNIKIPG